MSGLSETGTVLIAIFAFFLIAFAAQLVYVIWWRRRFRRRSTAATELDAFSSRGGDSAAISPSTPPTKELLYFFFFCLENNEFRIEPATAPPLPPPLDAAVSIAVEPPVDDVALKRPPPPTRSPFTIVEEREGSGADNSAESFDGTVGIKVNENASQVDENDAVESCSDSDHYEDETIPCSTPYYTPSPSPGHDDVAVTSV